jgi:FMN phosphatase YigB (HAD superfamily)
MRPKVLFIDWDGTLSDSRFWERWSVNPKHTAKYQLIQRVLFTEAHDLLVDWMRGYRTVGSVVEYVADVTGLSYEELITELQYSCEHMSLVDSSLEDLIQNIRSKGTAVVIATDNMDTFSRWTMPALKLDDKFDGTILSVDRGAMKADVFGDGTSQFFNHFFLITSVKPDETVLIDNSLNNKVVEKFGMNFLHVSDEIPLLSLLQQYV